MDAKEKVKLVGLKKTQQRLEVMSQQAAVEVAAVQPTFYQGYDASTGAAKFERLGQGVVSGGQIITTAGIAQGESVLVRPTAGLIRLDKRPPQFSESDFLKGNLRRDSSAIFGGDGNPDSEGDEDPDGQCPVEGTIDEDSVECIGLGLQYYEYTGGEDAEGECEKRQVIIPNHPICRPKNRSLPPGGCESTDNCQWFDVSQAQALSGQGCPVEMSFTGYVEFPEGKYRALCCSSLGEPPAQQGTGCGWRNRPVSYPIQNIACSIPTNGYWILGYSAAGAVSAWRSAILAAGNPVVDPVTSIWLQTTDTDPAIAWTSSPGLNCSIQRFRNGVLVEISDNGCGSERLTGLSAHYCPPVLY